MLGLEKYKKSTVITNTTVSVVVLLVLTALCIYSAILGETVNIVSDDTAKMFFILPFLLIGGLYGYLISLAVFMVSFVLTLIYQADNAYKMAVCLAATLCFALFGKYRFFESIKKTAIAAFCSLMITLFVELLCLSITERSAYGLSETINYSRHFLRDAGGIFALAFIFYLYITKTPDHWKFPFPVALAYTGFYEKDKDFRNGIKKTKISVKITTIIIAVELLLGIASGVFMMVLFPDAKEIFMIAVHHENEIRQESEEVPEDITSRIKNAEFRMNMAAVSYDIKMLLLMLCVGVPMAGFANFYVRVTIGTPLGNISDFMEEYAEADDENKIEVGRKVSALKVMTHDEMQVLLKSINATVTAIEDYIAHKNEQLELEKELEVAQEASEAKTAFLSNMSHEIRTPINAVLGLNEMILRESHEEQILEYANDVKSAGNSLLGIINDILDFSKIEAGKMDILPVEYHLSSTINDLLNLIAVRAEDKGLVLNMNIDRTLPTKLIGDEIRIKQCVTNILTNAVKYTEQGSITLNVSYRKADEDSIYLKFQVIDTGIGIKEEDLEKLYSPFERIEEIRNRSIEGTGLGMSIVKKLLALMDSRLEVKSVYGRGSDFSFEVKQQVASWEKLGDFKEKYKEFIKSQEKYHESFTAPDAVILVVDDTPMNLTVVKGLLKQTGIKVETAESGMETLELVKKKKYDVIFIDHRMPEMDGIETLGAMRLMMDNLSFETPCIALTANAGAGARDEYLAAGFDDYLAKPVNGRDLEKMLIKYLPADKVIMGSTKTGSDEVAQIAAAPDEKDVLDSLQGIDVSEAVKNCGSRDVLREVAKEFLISIDPNADNIERFAAEKDYRNYTVAVHALKSSARLIGAMELSGLAAELEECGNNKDESKIRGGTPHLLELYRSYNDKLSAINDKADESELPEISEEELKRAFSDIRELLEAYDFDTADGIMNELSNYRIPSEYKEKYNRVIQLMAAVDRDELLKVLEG